jgi:hypothetical protein
MKTGVVLLLAVAGVLQIAASARAQQALNVAVFRTGTKDAALKPLAEALDPVVLGELQEIDGVTVSARPPLDLQATQLALDCIGETSTCLRTVAEQAVADVVLSPSIDRAGEETVVTLLYFDARGEGGLETATRRHTGPDVERAALDAVPAMLRELFGGAETLPAVEPASPAARPTLSESDFGLEEPRTSQSAFPPVPVAITAAGVVVLGVGVAFGLMSNATEDEYGNAPVPITEAEVIAVNDTFDRAETQATIANIGYGVGGAAIALGVTLWILELSDDDGEREGAFFSPRLTPEQVGLTLHGRL